MDALDHNILKTKKVLDIVNRQRDVWQDQYDVLNNYKQLHKKSACPSLLKSYILANARTLRHLNVELSRLYDY